MGFLLYYINVLAVGSFIACDGGFVYAEISELVGIFMLIKISEKCDKNDIGLYRDDGLAVFKNISGPKSERIKKNFQSLFKKYGLEIIIECKKKLLIFLTSPATSKMELTCHTKNQITKSLT